MRRTHDAHPSRPALHSWLLRRPGPRLVRPHRQSCHAAPSTRRTGAGGSERNPAVNVRPPKVDYESRTLGPKRAGCVLGPGRPRLGSRPRPHLAGGAQRAADFRSSRRRRRWPRPPAGPSHPRALDLYLDERATGRIFLGAKGGRTDRYAADRTVKRLARRAGITKTDLPSRPATLVHHRCPACRRAVTGRARSSQPCRSWHHHALRPWPPGISGPPGHLHRRYLLRGGEPKRVVRSGDIEHR
jgi:hypothetical protein